MTALHDAGLATLPPVLQLRVHALLPACVGLVLQRTAGRDAEEAGEAATRDSLAAMRAELDELKARLDEAEASAERLPHRRKYLLLNARHPRGVLELQRKLVADVERELGTDAAA